MSQAEETPRSQISNIVLGIAVVIGVAWFTSIWWLPQIGQGPEDAQEAPAAGGEPLTMLQLSDEALATMDIDVEPLKRSPYERTISIPGRTEVLPGVGRREITTPTSGVVLGIFVREGEMVTPNQPLFQIKLVHDEGIKLQVELLDSLAEREILDADLQRLRDLERRSPGAIQGTRILEKEYRRQHLNHLIASRRQMLILLGLPQEKVDQMIDEHGKHEANEDHDDARSSLLLETVTIFAASDHGEEESNTPLLVEKLKVVMGQHVESGDVLCQIGDYRLLRIVGEAFERDSEAIRQARDRAWPITAVIERRGQQPEKLENLTIAGISPQVDSQSRSTPFYITLQNKLQEIPTADGEATRVDWVHRPGRRMELRVPTKRESGALKVPVAAVAEDGPNFYVFQASGNSFHRRRVEVLHRDEDFVVLKEGRLITDGVPIAMNGAYQLQLALLNASMDPATVAHGHAH